MLSSKDKNFIRNYMLGDMPTTDYVDEKVSAEKSARQSADSTIRTSVSALSNWTAFDITKAEGITGYESSRLCNKALKYASVKIRFKATTPTTTPYSVGDTELIPTSDIICGYCFDVTNYSITPITLKSDGTVNMATTVENHVYVMFMNWSF